MKRNLCILLTIYLLISTGEVSYAETISRGIDYTVRKESVSGTNQTFRQLTVTPDTGNRWLTSKGREHVLATEPLPSQMERYSSTGSRVVAAINADMYRVASGMPIGMQIQNNEVLVSHSVKESSLKFPSFVINGQGQAEIGSYGIVGTAKSATRSLTLHSLNRNEYLANRVGVFTSAHHPSKKIKLIEPSESMKKEVAIVTLQGAAVRAFKLGGSYEWTIKKVDTTFHSEIDIPSDGVVLVALGKQKNAMLDLVKSGKITTQFNLVQMSNLAVRNDIQEAVSGYNWLIKDGVGLDLNALADQHDRFLMLARKAHTLIGLTANQTVHILTVDQARADSKGITMLEAVAQMKRLGAVSALAFDGGGSTEMMVRREGEFPVKTVNYPADGRSRSITNGLLLATRYIPTNIAAKIIIPPQPDLYIGEKRLLSLKLSDKNGQPIDAAKKKVILSGKGVRGLEVQAGLRPETWTGKMLVDQVSQPIKINVTNRLSGLVVNRNQPIVMKVGQKLTIQSEGWFNSRKVTIPVQEKSEQLMNRTLATISKSIMTAKRAGKTTLIVTAGGRSISVPVTIIPTKTMDLLDPFEKGLYTSNSPYVSSYTTRLSTKQKTAGRSSLEMTYDYSGWKTQNGAMYLSSPNWVIPYPAKSLTLDVYGDQHAPWLRAKLKDAAGKSHTVDFVKKVDWTGFKTVRAKLDPSWQVPLKIETIYFVETDQKRKGDKTKHRVYLDQLKVWY